MGFVRKITGVQGQIDAANNNAAQIEAANKQNAQAAEQAAAQSARSAADQQQMLAARSAAESKAADAVSKPLATAEVSVAEEDGGNVSTKRARFGVRAARSGVRV